MGFLRTEKVCPVAPQVELLFALEGVIDTFLAGYYTFPGKKNYNS
jgi:hypothetical protein